MPLKFRWETEFKETEIGEIPKDWEVDRLLSAVRKLESGNRPKGGGLKHDPEGVLSIGGENITWQGELLLAECLRFKADFYASMKKGRIEEEDILLVKDGATIGKLAYIKNIPEGKAAVNEHIFLIKTNKENYNPRYLFYYLFSDAGQSLIESAIGGSAQGGLNKSILDIIAIPKLNISEQNRIAAVLSWFDDLIENKKKQNEILEKTAMAIFKSWFVDFEPFRDGEFVDSELGKIPKGWEILKLNDIISSQYGYTTSAEKQGRVKLLRITDINKNFVIDWNSVPWCNINEHTYQKYKLQNTDIVISRIADIGKVALIEDPPPSIYASYLIRLKIKPSSIITSYYLYYWLKSPFYQDYIKSAGIGSTRDNTNAKVIKSGPIIVPPVNQVKKFTSIVQSLRRKIILNQNQIMTLRKVRDTLLPLLVMGKLRVVESRSR